MYMYIHTPKLSPLLFIIDSTFNDDPEEVIQTVMADDERLLKKSEAPISLWMCEFHVHVMCYVHVRMWHNPKVFCHFKTRLNPLFV